MEGAATVFVAILIVAIAASMIALSMPWVGEKIQESIDVSEVSSIKTQFDSCNNMIIETARTGSTNKCIFSVSKGRVTGSQEGINYEVVSSASICDQQDWIQIDEKRHIWQKCEVSGNERIFDIRWKFPSELEIQGQQIVGNQLRGETPIANILFNNPIEFTTITLYILFKYREGEAGNIVEISRVDVNPANITLSIKIS